jgi:hypothetical protein
MNAEQSKRFAGNNNESVQKNALHISSTGQRKEIVSSRLRTD